MEHLTKQAVNKVILSDVQIGKLGEVNIVKKYEYKIITKGIPVALSVKKYDEMAQEIENELTQLGLEGWELVQWKSNMLIFKREVE